MLKNKTNYSSATQYQEADYSNRVKGALHDGLFVELPTVSELLPMRSNHKRSSSRVTGSQISWSNHAFSNKATFGQVLTFGPVGRECRVSRRGRSRPSLEGSFFGLQSEGVLRVNSYNGAPAKKRTSKDVANMYSTISNSHSWAPKQQPGNETNPNKGPAACHEQLNGFNSQSDYPEGGETEASNCNDLTRSGANDLFFHEPSVPYRFKTSEAGAM